MPNPEQHSENRLSKGTLFAGVVVGITASACCLGPLVLLMLGISGSWISNLSAMEPYRPIFIGLTLLFLGLAFRKLYLTPPNCTVDAPCAQPTNLRRLLITSMTTYQILTSKGINHVELLLKNK